MNIRAMKIIERKEFLSLIGGSTLGTIKTPTKIQTKEKKKKKPIYSYVSCDPINSNQTSLEKNVGKDPVDPTTGVVDWDASSGLLCGCLWGKCSDFAEIYMNILSPNAYDPILPKEVSKLYIEAFCNYNTTPKHNYLYQNVLSPPYCFGAETWGSGSSYNVGIMGPDWFGFYDKNNERNYGTIPAYGHYGDTYGYSSCCLYIPGQSEAVDIWKSDIYSYSNPNYTFKFFGGNDFTLVASTNNVFTQCSDAITEFFFEIDQDPFVWEKPS